MSLATYNQARRAGSNYDGAALEGESPIGLISRVYQEARLSAARAERAIQQEQALAKADAIHRLISCIAFLQNHLDMDKGKEVARGLDRLYSYMLQRVTDSNVSGDPEGVAEVGGHLAELGEAWAEAARRERESAPEAAVV